MKPLAGRHAIGAVVIDLFKFLKKTQRDRGKPFVLGNTTREFWNRRVLPTEWVPFEVFLELLELVDAVALHGDERRAMEMGALGGAAMRGVLKTYVTKGDPISSVVAMRHGWRAQYDFGRLRTEPTRERAVRFAVEEFPDMTMVHGLMTAGWGVAAARAAGEAKAQLEVLSRPWLGAPTFTYEISF